MASVVVGTYRAVRGIFLVSPWLAHLFVADFALSALLPVSTLAPQWVYYVSSKIAESVWRAIQLIFTRANGAHISVSGTLLPEGESAIVISNHVSWTDFYMIQALAMRSRMLGCCRYFAKNQLKWVPFLGWGLWAMGMPLVTRRWLQDRTEMNGVFQRIVQHQYPIWLISFSEATRFTSQKYNETVKWCKQQDKPVPQHALYPRTKGFVATVQELRCAPHVKAVYDVTIAYARGKEFLAAPSILESLTTPDLAKRYQFHVHVERIPLEDLPQSDTDLALWLEQRWLQKGEKLEILKKDLLHGRSWASRSV